jgi:hypothetical protein
MLAPQQAVRQVRMWRMSRLSISRAPAGIFWRHTLALDAADVVFGQDGRTCEGVVLEYLNTNVKGPRKIINQEHKKTNRPEWSAVPLPLREHRDKTPSRARSQTLPVPLLANGTCTGDTNSLQPIQSYMDRETRNIPALAFPHSRSYAVLQSHIFRRHRGDRNIRSPCDPRRPCESTIFAETATTEATGFTGTVSYNVPCLVSSCVSCSRVPVSVGVGDTQSSCARVTRSHIVSVSE